jgi:hypothetical protein
VPLQTECGDRIGRRSAFSADGRIIGKTIRSAVGTFIEVEDGDKRVGNSLEFNYSTTYSSATCGPNSRRLQRGT